MENVNSLGQQNWNGYGPQWNVRYQQERQKLTSGGFPKMDLVRDSQQQQQLCLGGIGRVHISSCAGPPGGPHLLRDGTGYT